jgi:hypothetical protein
MHFSKPVQTFNPTQSFKPVQTQQVIAIRVIIIVEQNIPKEQNSNVNNSSIGHPSTVGKAKSNSIVPPSFKDNVLTASTTCPPSCFSFLVTGVAVATLRHALCAFAVGDISSASRASTSSINNQWTPGFGLAVLVFFFDDDDGFAVFVTRVCLAGFRRGWWFEGR